MIIGSFCHHGSKSEFIELDDDNEVSRLDDPKDPKPSEYKLMWKYWVHNPTKVFRRRTITLQDHVGEMWLLIILQYSNTSGEEDVEVEPHKNAKKNLEPFVAATSTKQHIYDKA